VHTDARVKICWPRDLDLWHFDLEMKPPVTHAIWNLCANFELCRSSDRRSACNAQWVPHNSYIVKNTTTTLSLPSSLTDRKARSIRRDEAFCLSDFFLRKLPRYVVRQIRSRFGLQRVDKDEQMIRAWTEFINHQLYNGWISHTGSAGSNILGALKFPPLPFPSLLLFLSHRFFSYLHHVKMSTSFLSLKVTVLTLYRMVMPIGTPFLKEKINN